MKRRRHASFKNITRLQYLTAKLDAAPKAAPGLLMREQMGWLVSSPASSPQPNTSRSAFSFQP